MAKRKHLTDAAVARQARPQTGRIELKDVEPGLSMRVTPNGVKSWTVVYRLSDADGKRTVKKRKTIGHYPGLGVADARDRARQINELARQGVDPEALEAEERAIAEREAAEAQAGSFGSVAEKFVLAMKASEQTGGRRGSVTAKTAEGRKRLLARHVLPTLGEHPLGDVTPTRINRLLEDVAARRGPVDEVLAAIRLVFKFAAARGLFQGAPPTLGLVNRRARKKQDRRLTDSELREIWSAAGEHGSFGRVIRLLMITGQRRSEIAEMRWREFDRGRRMLIVPVGRVKNRAGEHEVPLATAALQVLQEAEACALAAMTPQARERGLAADALVFPSDDGEVAISGWSKLKPLLNRTIRANRAGLTEDERRAVRATGALRPDTRTKKANALAKIDAAPAITWRIHDLRHTFITRCRDGDENAEGEIVWSAPLDVLQATVNHEITAGVTGRYDHGDLQRRYRLRKRELMEWWSRKLMEIVGEAPPQDNVVQLPMGGRG